MADQPREFTPAGYVCINHDNRWHFLLSDTTTSNPLSICTNLASHAFDKIEVQQLAIDNTEYALAVEYDSGRALRIAM